MRNLRKEIRDEATAIVRRTKYTGTVTGTDGALVIVTATAGPSGTFAKLASYTSPVNGDRVAIEEWGEGVYLVLGKIG